LLLVQLAGFIVPFVLLNPVVPPGFLVTAGAHALQLKVAVGLLLLNGVVTITIAAVVWPVLRRSSEVTAVLLLTASTIMCVLQVIDNAHLLSMLSLSEHYLAAASKGEFLEAMGTALRSTRRWVHYAELFSIEVWVGLLYAVLLHARAIPRALAILGLGTAVLHFGAVVMPFYVGRSSVMLLGMPMGLSQLALVAWLVARGFNQIPSTVTGGGAATQA
jgi:hypothetical protein